MFSQGGKGRISVDVALRKTLVMEMYIYTIVDKNSTLRYNHNSHIDFDFQYLECGVRKCYNVKKK